MKLLLQIAALFAIASTASAVPTVTVAEGQGPFAPFTPSNNDLLQTNLATVSSGGDFTREGTGGVPILNNGAFSITGQGGNNPELATVIDNSFVQFDLDLTAAPAGYNISSIDTYGGWNDAGRDRQTFAITYSVVGDPLFVPFDSINADNPNNPGFPSAIRAVFSANLTGVDSIRLDFPAGQENGHAGLGEVDVIGVPEPGTASLLFGTVAVLGTLRRRR